MIELIDKNPKIVVAALNLQIQETSITVEHVR